MPPIGIPIVDDDPVINEAILVAYIDLSLDARTVVEEVKARFEDMYDSIHGGPHLADESDRFNDNKYALLLKHAVQRINGMGSVVRSYTLDSYPFSDALGAGAATSALMVEVIKHFIISFTEEPSASDVNGPYLSRGEYYSRWKEMLADAESDLKGKVSSLDAAVAFSGGAGYSTLVWTNQMPYGVQNRVRPLRPPWYR